MNKKTIGFFSGIAVFIIIYLLPLTGLEQAGHMTLALTLMTVVWWATQVAQSGFIGGIYLALLVITHVAEPSVIFKSWTGSTMWLVIGAYLIAGAVTDSGLGERMAYAFINKFVRSYKGLVAAIFVLTFILSLMIPHPWPRAFLLMAVMTVVAKAANMPKEDTVKLGFTVFAASCPVSMFFLTGDATLNPLAVANSGVECGFLQWFRYMSVPMVVASAITMILLLVLFKPSKEISIDFAQVHEKQKALGKLSAKEKRVAVWLVIAIILWMTDKIHGINVGWITLIVALLMSMPVIGGVLTPKSWSQVPVHVLVFLTSAMAIGTVGGATGMNAWIAKTILPATIPQNIFVLALLIAVFSMVVHMFMGSVIAVMGVCIPALVAFTNPAGISPLAVSMMVFSAVNMHYILPFHNLAILVGCEPDTGGYTEKECIRMGIPLTFAVFVVVLVEAAWFKLNGLL